MNETCHGLVQPAKEDRGVQSGGLYMISGFTLDRTTFCCAKAGRRRARPRDNRESVSSIVRSG